MDIYTLKKISTAKKIALSKPLIITEFNQPKYVLISYDLYIKLIMHDKKIFICNKTENSKLL